MHISFLYLLFAFVLENHLGLCKNILAIFPFFGKTHYFMYQPYVQKLAERGHNVTLITSFKVSNLHPNIETINFGGEPLSEQLKLVEYESCPSFLFHLRELQQLNQWGQDSCSQTLSNPKIKDFIKSKKRYDLVVVEYFNTDCFAVFAHLFKAPLMGIFSSSLMPWHNDRMGNPDNPSYIVNMFQGFFSKMDFFTRAKNTILTIFDKVYYKLFYEGPTDRIIKRHLGKGIPKTNELIKNTSVFLVNTHFSLFQPRPLVPGVVEVGGLHVQPPKKLPADIDNFLENSKNGVIYFSLGTVTQGSSLPVKKRDALIRAFSNISMDVLWKWESDDMPGKPKNVMIKKWVPQNDVLGHPNVKLFITHSGLMGTLEAVTHGVPMIAIPLFGDQFLNAASVAEKGAGIVYDYFQINEMKFLKTLKAVLEDKKYSENAKLLSSKFKERPLTAMNNAIYWTEYVLKFKGAYHLRSAALNLSWISECLIDVALVVLATLLLIIYICKKGISKYKAMKNATNNSQKKKN